MTWTEFNEHDIKVYSTMWCPDCRRLEHVFDNRDVSYEVIDIDKDPAAAEHLKATTNRTAIPFVEVDGGPMIRGWHTDRPGGFDEELFLEEVEQALAKA
ncbi:MAG: glutaredoxin family protein [Lentisphaeria bacterium]|nr:glutaredoxin family protein [Lentisphaeria bacterium]